MLQLGHIRNAAFLQRLFKKKSPPTPIKFRIPKDFASSIELTNLIDKVVKDPKSWVFLDTSFLMWLTKIGPTSRQQCFNWLEAKFPGRVCVPVWSAHEYLRHQASDTIKLDLSKRCKEMGKIARKGYFLLRPYLDPSPHLESGIANNHQVLARKTFQDLEKLSKLADVMKKQLKDNADDVIHFINKHVPDSMDIFSVLGGVQSWGEERYDGRIPPGFQDKAKKNIEVEDDGDGDDDGTRTLGTNKYGDLLFWKEILEVSSNNKAKNAVILTNDLKNDWQMAGRKSPSETDLKLDRTDWKPYPIPHPMLCYEAGITAKLEEVLLLDAVYLGLYLKRHDHTDKVDLVDVALVPMQPFSAPTFTSTTSSKPGTAHNIQSAASPIVSATSVPAVSIQSQTYRFSDMYNPPNLSIALKTGWNKPSKDINEDHLLYSLVQKIEVNFTDQHSIADLFTKENLTGLNIDLLIALGKWIHDKSLTDTLGSPEAPTDVLNILLELPPITASSLYMGFLGSMYIDKDTGKPRIPPQSRVGDLIYDLQKETFAHDPILTLRDRFKKESILPLYVPDTNNKKVNVELEHIPESDGEFILGSVRFDGIEVYSPAQKKPELNLLRINQNEEIQSPLDIVKAACHIYSVPLGSVNISSDFNTAYKIIQTAGFRPPRDIFKTNLEVDHE